MTLYELYLYLLVLVKLSVIFFFIKNKFVPSDVTEKNFLFAEDIFTALMSLLIIFLFHPYSKNPLFIDRETKLFLFTFAILTLVHTFK